MGYFDKHPEHIDMILNESIEKIDKDIEGEEFTAQVFDEKLRRLMLEAGLHSIEPYDICWSMAIYISALALGDLGNTQGCRDMLNKMFKEAWVVALKRNDVAREFIKSFEEDNGGN